MCKHSDGHDLDGWEVAPDLFGKDAPLVRDEVFRVLNLFKAFVRDEQTLVIIRLFWYRGYFINDKRNA